MTYFFETYGCQMNTAESAALDLVCRERGWEKASGGESADLVLINTCSVRITAEQRVMGRLALYASLKKKRAFILVVAGCMAQRLGEGLKKQIPAVDYVMGTDSRSLFPFILEAAENGAARNGAPAFPEQREKPVFSFSSSHLEEGSFRSFVPIMHGCNNFCSYCIVPSVRGREISRSPQSIINELRLLSEKGVREITLLGQNVNSYKWEGNDSAGKPGFSGKSLDFPALLTLVAQELEGSPIRWVRFLSANPGDFSPRTIRIMADNRIFCRHLHLPVQHGSDRILRMMNRRYSREHYLALVREIRSSIPGITLSTDILVGFPGETEADSEETLRLMEEVRFLYAYMYHYNPREGTAAYRFPGRVDEKVRLERLARVIALQQKHTAELLEKRVGSRELALIEGSSRKNADELMSRTERDEMAVVPGKVSMTGSFVELTLCSLNGNTFRAGNVVPVE
jgi:tRNA-2-methylthio-N6-dimethylallyladenosine synthase